MLAMLAMLAMLVLVCAVVPVVVQQEPLVPEPVTGDGQKDAFFVSWKTLS
jgi:hypothetical protein